MFTEEEVKDVATCGIYCGQCPAYTCKDNPVLLEAVVAKGLKREDLPCPGCREHKGKCAFTDGDCATYDCAEKHEVTFCYECAEFPCQYLHPCADRADVLPHNLKVYNLCYIKTHGLEAFKQKYPDIAACYYTGKMAIGKGPQLG
jgi:hypothetical protein